MSHEARSPAEARALASGEIYLWSYAVDLQGRRVLAAATDVDREVDTVQFAFALRNVIRAAVMAAKLGLPVQPAIDQFTAKFPNAIDVRDLLEHFDAYILGAGKLQQESRKDRGGKPRLTGYVVFFERRVDRVIAHVGDWVLDVQAAAEAAMELTNAVLDAAHRP